MCLCLDLDNSSEALKESLPKANGRSQQEQYYLHSILLCGNSVCQKPFQLFYVKKEALLLCTEMVFLSLQVAEH